MTITAPDNTENITDITIHPAICAICGKPIQKRPSFDHAYPKAVYKWAPAFNKKASVKKLKSLIESPDNILLTHKHCNYKKQDEILDTEKLYVSNDKREALLHIRDQLTEEADRYEKFKKKVLKKQKNRCHCCRWRIKTGILRRIDIERNRTKDNACVVCDRCNEKFRDFTAIKAVRPRLGN